MAQDTTALNKLGVWRSTWQMRFTSENFYLMHLMPKNMHASYFLGEAPLVGSVMEKDLWLLVDQKLGNSMQCQAATNKARRFILCTNKFIFLYVDVFKR